MYARDSLSSTCSRRAAVESFDIELPLGNVLITSNVDQNPSKDIRESIWAKLRKESGARLREERMRLKLSQEAFAEKVGVHRRTQLNYEAGEREPDAAYYEAAASLGIDLPYVLEGERIERLPALAARVARRLFGGDVSPAGASVQALEN